MLNPEYYTGAYRLPNGSWCTTKYEDFSSEHEDLSACQTVIWERKPLFCVSVPGEATWIQQGQGKENHQSNQDHKHQGQGEKNTMKRRMEMEMEVEVEMETTADEMETEETTTPHESKSIKMETQQTTKCCSSVHANVCMPCCNPKKRENTTRGGVEVAAFRNPNEGKVPCLLKVYENGGGLDKVKLNEVVEVVGILSCDPRLTIFENGQYEEGEEVTEEDIVNNPPASKVPRIHVIAGKQVNCYQNALECLTPSFLGALARRRENVPGGGEGLTDFRQDPRRLGVLRERVISLLAKALRGDKLAAEYLLLHLLSKTQREGGHSQQLVGKHALNIFYKKKRNSSNNSNNNNENEAEANLLMKEFVREVNEMLVQLVPRCQTLGISLQKLNEKPLWPRKDYKVNRLLGGPLLLADRTHLVLDETELTTGQLQAAGLLNYNCLKHLMTFQSMEVDFQFYKLPIHCNIPILVLSEEKSLLPCDTTIPLQPTEEERPLGGSSVFAQAMASLCVDDLAELRFYLCSIQMLEYSIPSDVSDYLQQEFVQQRQKDPQSANADSFHRSLTLSRLMTQSYGEKELSVQHWRRIGAMEEARKQRQQQS